MEAIRNLYLVADELRAQAAQGLQYASNEYDRGRYHKVLEASAVIVAALEQQSVEKIQHLFEGNLAQVSPRLAADAAIFRQGQILLMRRNENGLWCMPGGMVEVGESLVEAVQREVWEEVGLRARVVELLGIFDSRNPRWLSLSKYHLNYVVFQMEAEGEPQTSLEATEVGFFSEDNLPSLFSSHRARVPFAFRLMRKEAATPYLD